MKLIIGVTIGVVVLIVGIVGAVAMFASGSSEGGGSGIGTTVRLAPVVVGELIENRLAPGRVEPVTNVAISARVSARIAEIPFEAGDHVTKGDPDADPPVPPSLLIRLDATDLEALLRSAKARRGGQAAQIEVEKARIDGQVASLKGTNRADEADRDLNRHRELVAAGDVSQMLYEQVQKRYDELSSQYESALANLEAARRSLVVSQFNLDAAADAEIERANDNLSYTSIYSPIDGIVTIVNVEPGEIAVTGTMNNPGTVLLEVADLSTMLVVAELDEADIAQVKEGQPAKVRMLAYPDRIFDGEVSSVALSATRLGTKFFKTEILLQTDDEQIYTGLTADAEIEVARHEDIKVVPSQAVLGRPVEELPTEIREDNEYVDQNKTIATVVYRFIDGKAVVTPVKIGPSDVTHTTILGGLGADEQVVIGPYKALEDLKHDQKLKDEKAEKAKEDSEDDKKDKSDKPDASDSETDKAKSDESEPVDDKSTESIESPESPE